MIPVEARSIEPPRLRGAAPRARLLLLWPAVGLACGAPATVPSQSPDGAVVVGDLSTQRWEDAALHPTDAAPEQPDATTACSPQTVDLQPSADTVLLRSLYGQVGEYFCCDPATAQNYGAGAYNNIGEAPCGNGLWRFTLPQPAAAALRQGTVRGVSLALKNFGGGKGGALSFSALKDSNWDEGNGGQNGSPPNASGADGCMKKANNALHWNGVSCPAQYLQGNAGDLERVGTPVQVTAPAAGNVTATWDEAAVKASLSPYLDGQSNLSLLVSGTGGCPLFNAGTKESGKPAVLSISYCP